jgi:hypothetical protein
MPLAHRMPKESTGNKCTIRTASKQKASILDTTTINNKDQYVCESCVHAIFPPSDIFLEAVVTEAVQKDQGFKGETTVDITLSSSSSSANTSSSSTTNDEIINNDDIFSLESGQKYAEMCSFSYTKDDVDSLNDQIQSKFNCQLVAWRTFSDGTGFYIALEEEKAAEEDDDEKKEKEEKVKVKDNSSTKLLTSIATLQSASNLYIIFRGTCNAKNIQTDSRFSLSKFPLSGKHCSKVHVGFLDSYLTARLEMLSHVRNILNQRKEAKSTIPNIVVLGHSLGGALASLACVDLKTTLISGPFCNSSHLISYTYGCPRVGNNEFAQLYNSLIPRTARVANENDAIAKLPLRSILYPYKHCCTLVRVERDGNVIVSPPRRSKLINVGLVRELCSSFFCLSQ